MKILAERLCQEGLPGCTQTLWERAQQWIRDVCQECARGNGLHAQHMLAVLERRALIQTQVGKEAIVFNKWYWCSSCGEGSYVGNYL